MPIQPNRFKDLIENTNEFVITCEHIPGRFSGGKKLDNIVEFAAKGVETGLVHAISLTDNPGGAPAISPDVIAQEVERAGMPAIAHFSAKDLNRNMLESRALGLARTGVRNLLVMSGDFQTLGQAGLPMPVFDLDPVHILAILNLMNDGRVIDPATRELVENPPTDFFPGAVVSPFKFTEAGSMLQYYKMEKKLRAGARYLITQLGFDSRKLRDLLAYMKGRGIDIPLLGSVFILRKGACRRMNCGDIPGSFVTDELMAEIQAESAADDKGRAASLERAAMQIAVLKGLGFRGAHIEAMILKFDMIETILGRAAELEGEWEECAGKLRYAPRGTFYLGGNGSGNGSDGAKLSASNTAASPASKRLRRGWGVFQLMQALHDVMFVKQGGLSGLMRGVTALIDRNKQLSAVTHVAERAVKEVLFDCRDCGDCALPELQFLCPQSQCPKQERNGPCGGSRLDACEVYPDRPCVWHRVYVRAKAAGELDALRDTIIGPRDWKLRDTSGWANFHLGRDHTGYEFGELMGLGLALSDDSKGGF